MKNLFPYLILILLCITTTSYKKTKTPSAIAKELYFPVTGNKSNIGSLWGDERDGGRRRHEGIDIFAAKGTPLVAISDGIIKLISDDELGGKTVTLQPNDYEWEAYYAHLDKQYVVNGQYVKKGQLIGTVGNTGNARTTPSHLHFGIYTTNGAIDPLPYVKTSPKISSPVPADKNAPVVIAPKKSGGSSKKTQNKALETEVKNAAVKVITGELWRRIKIRL
ncbi:MAG: M23 family metallopeptidase [Ferruginibacter sp.]